MKILVVSDDGRNVTDATEGVRVLWDLFQSIILGSGLTDAEEDAALATLRDAAGFADQP